MQAEKMKILFYGAGVMGSLYAARDEMKQIADDFKVLAQSTSVPTPAMDRLYTYIARK